MNVSTTHPDYDLHVKQWTRNYDALNDLVKSKKQTYLPMPGKRTVPNGLNAEGQKLFARLQDALIEDYNNYYLPSAVWYNYSQPTVEAVTGAITRKDPQLELPAMIEYLIKDADGSGLSLTQQIKAGLGYVYSYGRCGLLVDMPKTKGSYYDNATGKVAPRIKLYGPTSIINWCVSKVDSVDVLSLVVIREVVPVSLNVFMHSTENQYLVYRIDEYGDVIYERYSEAELIESDYIKENGRLATSIPFYFVGACNNDAECDPAPMTPIIELNLRHYTVYASHLEQIRVAGQAQYHIDIGEMKSDEYTKLNPAGFLTGSKIPIITAKGGSATVLQTSTDSLLKEEVTNIELRSIKIGAQLLEQGTNETATGAQIRSSASSAKMSAIAKNWEAAYTSALQRCAEMMGQAPDSVTLKMNDDFFDRPMTAQDRTAYMASVMNGLFSMENWFAILKQSGDIPESTDFDEWKQQLSEGSTTGGMFA